MKKIFVLLLALTCVGFVMAEDADTSAEVTYGFSGSFGYNVIQDNMTDTFGDDFSDPEAKWNPESTFATGYAASPWFAVDWATWGIKVEATHDAYNDNDDDGYSSLTLSTEWFKDVEEFALTSALALDNSTDNSGAGIDTDLWEPTLNNASYTMTATLDTETLGAGMTVDVTDFIDLVNGQIGASALTATIDGSWVEARDMFGMWTSTIGDSGEKDLRPISYNTLIELGEFENDFDNAFIDYFNTIAISDALTAYVGMELPINTFALVDYLAGKGYWLGMNMDLEGLGSVDAGALVRMDYAAKQDVGAGIRYYEGNTQIMSAQNGATAADVILADLANGALDDGNVLVDNGIGFWVDADLSDMMEALSLTAGFEMVMSEYLDAKSYADDVAAGKGTAPGNYIELASVPAQKMSLGVDSTYAVSDALSIDADVVVGLGLGFDNEKWAGAKWDDAVSALETPDTAFITDNYKEANYAAAAVYGMDIFKLALKGTFALNDTISVYAGNTFVLNDGWIVDQEDASAPGDFQTAVPNARDIYGFYDKDVIEVGAKFTASEESSVSVDFDYNLYLGLPGASDLYDTGLTDAQKQAVDSAYAEWKSNSFTPFSLSVSYSFSY